jgi:hypothetical protein
MSEISEVVDTFTCNNRKCVVVKMELSHIPTYHNGYVECNDGFDGDMICDEDITNFPRSVVFRR